MAYRSEADVQRFYQNQLEKLVKNDMKKDIKKFELSTKFMKNINTDGYIMIDNTHLVLCEFKDGFNFSNSKRDMAIAVIQALYYVKEFKEKTAIIPEALFIGDEDEYFILPTSIFINEGILDDNSEDRFWNCTPSYAYRVCPKLLERILEIINTKTSFVFKIENGKIDYTSIKNILTEIFKNKKSKIKFNSESLKYGYKLFINEVIYREEDFSSLQKISVFKDLIMKDGKTVFDNKYECLIFNKGEETEFKIPIKNLNTYKDFMSLYSVRYNESERKEVLEKITKLYNERERIEKSAFPKEKEIVDYAHKMMSKHLGKDWKEKYIVWDPRCYTGNLTKDYKFENLYLSNPFAEELNLIPNKGKCKDVFQFDFKNDEIKPKSRGGKLPDELYYVLKHEPERVVIFTDPEMRKYSYLYEQGY